MIKFRNAAALLALSTVAALPACSMYEGGYYGSQPSSASASQSPALSQDMVRQVQTRLQQAGTYSDRIDGLWGPQTEAAVRSYQQQHNLNATGQLDGDTLTSLNLGGTDQNSGNVPPVAVAPPVANAQPTSLVSGAGNTVPANTNIPPGSATQPNASTTP
jgi:peptidoglycan hydrolase-like protein with peptidoglycan-binding domain